MPRVYICPRGHYFFRHELGKFTSIIPLCPTCGELLYPIKPGINWMTAYELKGCKTPEEVLKFVLKKLVDGRWELAHFESGATVEFARKVAKMNSKLANDEEFRELVSILISKYF